MKKSILIVDDEKNALRAYARQLRKFNYKVLAAESGSHALAIMKKEPVELIVLDQMMPEMDGLETFSKIKMEFSHIPVIMVTAHSSITLSVEFMKEGGADFLEKPIDFEILDIKIQQSLREVELRQKLRETEAAKREVEEKKRISDAKLKTVIDMAATLRDKINNPLTAIMLRAEAESKNKSKGCGEIMGLVRQISKFLDDCIRLKVIETEKYGGEG